SCVASGAGRGLVGRRRGRLRDRRRDGGPFPDNGFGVWSVIDIHQAIGVPGHDAVALVTAAARTCPGTAHSPHRHHRHHRHSRTPGGTSRATGDTFRRRHPRRRTETATHGRGQRHNGRSGQRLHLRRARNSSARHRGRTAGGTTVRRDAVIPQTVIVVV